MVRCMVSYGGPRCGHKDDRVMADHAAVRGRDDRACRAGGAGLSLWSAANRRLTLVATEVATLCSDWKWK